MTVVADFTRCPFCDKLRVRCRSEICAEARRIEDEIDVRALHERGDFTDDDVLSMDEFWAQVDADEEDVSEAEMMKRFDITEVDLEGSE